MSEPPQIKYGAAEHLALQPLIPVCLENVRLFGLGSSDGANTFAGAAVEALIGVDYILSVQFRDSTCGALLCAGTATDALIGIDLICHLRITSYHSNACSIISHIPLKWNMFLQKNSALF